MSNAYPFVKIVTPMKPPLADAKNVGASWGLRRVSKAPVVLWVNGNER